MTTLTPKFDLKDGGSTPTGAINRPINEKLADMVSVKDFGAVGDGTTDDKLAIQAALDATSGKILYFPAGNYIISGSMYINNPVHLYFDPSAVIKVIASYTYLIAFEVGYNGAVNNVTIDGATFDFNNQTTSQYGIGVRILDNATNVTISNCTFKNFFQSTTNGSGGDGILIRLLNSSAPQNINIENCNFTNIGRNGISVTNYINGLNISNCTFNNCMLFGIDLEPDTGANNQQQNIYISQCSFYECGNNSNSYYSSITGGIQAVTGGTFLIFNNLNIRDCDFYFNTAVNSNGLVPLNINMFTNMLISGCVINNTTTSQNVTCYVEQTTNNSELGIVENCFFNNCQLKSFLSNDFIITGNRFQGNQSLLYIGNNNASNIKVIGNTFYNCGLNSSNLYVIYAASTFILIDGNTFHDYRGASAQPINVISLTGLNGSSYNLICNNIVDGAWSGYFINAYDGINLTHNDRNQVSNNTIQGCGLISSYKVIGWTVNENYCNNYSAVAIIFDNASSCSITNNHLIDCGTNVPSARVNVGGGGIYVSGNSITSTLTSTNRPTYAITASGATSTASYFLGNFSQNTQSGFSIPGTEGTSTNNLAL
jgi:hypothetical protein